MYKREIENQLKNRLFKGKTIVVIGPRQVGKTTLIQHILSNKEHLFLDGDDPSVRDILTNPNTEKLKAVIGSHRIVFIDEAQRIKNIGITAKIINDQLTDVQLILSGSSSFEIQNELSEPLTGRTWEFELYPISWSEFEQKEGYVKAQQKLPQQLVYGMYPDVLNHPGDEKTVLNSLTNSYLYRDILALHQIRKPELLEKLVKALAFQIGNQIKYNELAQTIGADKETVQKYIDILEKGFVVFRLGAFSRNVRNELKTSKKVYFYDNGIRNGVIGNYSDIDLRQDRGALWENFLISERIKQNMYQSRHANTYFWRTKQQQEVDYVEETDGIVSGFEFKWKAKPNARLPKTFTNVYKTGGVIDLNNFRSFIM